MVYSYSLCRRRSRFSRHVRQHAANTKIPGHDSQIRETTRRGQRSCCCLEDSVGRTTVQEEEVLDWNEEGKNDLQHL